MIPPALRPFLIGLVVTPLAAKMAKPLTRVAIRAALGLALEIKKIASDASGELRNIAAEAASADMTASSVKSRGTGVAH